MDGNQQKMCEKNYLCSGVGAGGLGYQLFLQQMVNDHFFLTQKTTNTTTGTTKTFQMMMMMILNNEPEIEVL